MFRSKINSAAARAQVDVAFAASRDAALASMQATRPALVIVDLNNPRVDPLGVITTMKADAVLAPIPIIGFVSHVDVDVAAGARSAGADEVLARSAFAARLPQLLASR